MAGGLTGGGARRTSSGLRQKKQMMHEINVTPFVDVMLVLLVVFMVTAPLIIQGVDVSLPEVQSAPLQDREDPIQISIRQNGAFYIQSQRVEAEELVNRLQAIRKVRPNAALLLRADKGVQYGKVMEVMSKMQAAGLVDVGLVTEPVGQSG